MRAVSVLGGSVVLLAVATSAQHAGSPGPSLLKATFSRLPIYFIENRDVYPHGVAYYVQGADKTLFFTKDGITFRLEGKDRSWAVKLAFVGANPDVVPRGEDRQPAVVSYFTGPEKDWKTGLTTYARVVYRDLWPGIDLIYEGTVNRLKYAFVVKPGSDPGRIRLRYQGVTSVRMTGTGALRVETPNGSFEDARPVAWQVISGKRVPVELAYTLGENGRFGFEVGRYDETRTLVLDPAVLVYCGYLGGSGSDLATAIAVDAAGNAYVAGETASDPKTFPVKVGPGIRYEGGYRDAFVAKINVAGTALAYCGYIGGSGSENAHGIAVDGSGNAYVTGATNSDQRTFPVKGGPDLTFNGAHDAFVARIDAKGTALHYCGYVGGVSSDVGVSVAVDGSGSAYVTGYANSSEQTFPVKVGPDLTFNGSVIDLDAYVAKVSPQGTGLVYCGYIGGASRDIGHGIAVDAAGNAFVAGATQSDERTFPVQVGPGLVFAGGEDAFVAKVNAEGKALVYCGYIGGVNQDAASGVAVDPAGRAYVAGNVWLPGKSFPAKVGPDLSYNGGLDAFVARVNPAGSALDYCGYVGGFWDDKAEGIAVDGSGNAYLSGTTTSDQQTFPTRVGPDLSFNGNSDAFVAKLNALGSALDYCGYIGGANDDVGNCVAVDRCGNLFVAGLTGSSETSFPVAIGPDLTFNGGPNSPDAFLAKVAQTLLSASGRPQPGGTITLSITASNDARRVYQVGTSLGAGPIQVDTRRIGLSPDALLALTVAGAWPAVFAGYSGAIGDRGDAAAAIRLPNNAGLTGTRLYSAFVTVEPTAPSGIHSISNTVMFTIGK